MSSLFPAARPRRLRSNENFRSLFQESEFTLNDLVLPIFVEEEIDDFVPINSMPGVQRIPESKLAQEVERYARAGIKSVMTFGVSHHLDATGSDTWQENGLVSRISRTIKSAVPEMIVMSDTCFCEYTDHGHCGVMHGGHVDNDATIENLGKQAVMAARAGADVIAPSAAMDGQVKAIRAALDAAGFTQTPIMAYSTKFASALYGPFREAGGSALKGDRKTYQMNPMNRREALRESLLDEAEGADALMVKPAGAYLDIIRESATGGVSGQRRVRDDQVRRPGRRYRRTPRRARNPRRDQTRGCGSDLHVLCDGFGAQRDLISAY
jgi:porphobilinogen synthase